MYTAPNGDRADPTRNEVLGENRLIAPFLACGSLAGYDADQNYVLKSADDIRPVVQPPTSPAYKKAFEMSKKRQYKRFLDQK